MVDDPSPMPITPLNAAVHGIGRYRRASTVAQLAYMLLNYWPEAHKGDEWRAARNACLDALEKQTGAEDARDAFIVAAAAAGISTGAGLERPTPRDKNTKPARR